MDQPDPDLKELERHAAQLSERFDSVRIIATHRTDGLNCMSSFGNGNWHAQIGSVREWLFRRDEEVRLSCRYEADDDG